MRTLSPARACLLLGCLALACLSTGSLAQEPAGAEPEPRLVVETRELATSIEERWAESDRLAEQRDAATGEEREILQRRVMDLSVDVLTDVDTLVDNVVQLEELGVDTSDSRSAAERMVTKLAPLAHAAIARLQGEIADLAGQREEVSGEELVKLEAALEDDQQRFNLLLRLSLDNADNMNSLGLDGDRENTFLAEFLTDRAGTTGARIELALEQIATVQKRLGAKPGDADLESELTAAEAKRDSSTANLSAAIEMMDRLGLETADYQRLVIQSTGQISADILDSGVALSLFQKWLDNIGNWLVDSGPQIIFKALVFLLILFAFHMMARVTKRVVRRAVSTSKLQFSQLLQDMFVSSSGNAVRLLGLLVALSQFGFELGPILTGLGIAGFVLGFALQETLGNFAAGMMILIYRPFDVEDMIEAAGVFGKVNAMNMVSTTVLTIDNQTLVVPNGKIWGDVIKNVTAQKVRRVDLVFGVSYADDIPQTESVLAQILKEHPKVLDDPEAVIKLHTLNESSVDFIVRPWVKTEDYWDVYWDITREVKMRFDREGISIPFPQRDVHFYEQKRLASAASHRGGSETS